MSLKFLLDTTIISAPIAKQPNLRVVRRLERHGAQCALAAPVWHELVFGCSRLPAGRRRTALEEYLTDVVGSSFPILPYDATAAEWHGRERARLEELGETPPFVDSLIAAIACSQNLTLVTANTRHFESFEHLDLVDWSR